MSSIHPSASIDPAVELGEGVTVEPYAVIFGPCVVGDGAWIGPHAAIGTPAQMRGGPHHRGDDSPRHGVSIGAGSVVREFVTVHQGTERTTEVGADCYLMAYAHVPHDAVIGRGCTLSNGVQIGGHTWIGDHANLGLGATVHQRATIGAYAMVGMQSAVTVPVPPFAKVVGVPGRIIGANSVGMDRLGLDPATAEMITAHLRGEREPLGELPAAAAAHLAAYEEALIRG